MMASARQIMLSRGLVPSKDIAQALGKSNSTVNRLVHAGSIHSVLDGRTLYVDVDAVAAHLRGRGNEPMAACLESLKRSLLAEESHVDPT